MGMVAGTNRVFFAGGNGVLYAFEPLAPSFRGGDAPVSLRKVWQFDLDPDAPKENVHRYNSNRREGPSNVFGMPVYFEGRLYVGAGGDLWWGKNEAWLKCIAADGRGDITTTNLRWSYRLERHVLSTAAVHEGLVFIADCGGNLHCVEAASGEGLWTHELGGEIWASPLVADGKVYLGTRRGQFAVFNASREKRLLSLTNVGAPISATATAANGVLYVATMNELFALKAEQPASADAE